LGVIKDPTTIVIRPHITERTVKMSYGDPLIKDEALVQRKYVFIVATTANKIEIKRAIETLYNEGKKDGEKITVESVRTVTIPGKTKRVGQRKPGKRPDRKKAIITLAKGQMIEDYGV
jgi:large subunit ribosomal protein L23